MKSLFVAIAILVTLAPGLSRAQQPPPEPVAGEAAVPPAQPPPPDGSGPVAVPEPSEKTMRYYRSGNLLWVVGVVWGLAAPCLLLFTGLSARMRDWAGKIGKRWFFTLATYLVLLIVTFWVLELPLSYYSDFVRQHDYGLSNQTFSKWFSDSLTALLVTIVIALLVAWGPFLILKKSPRRWWLYISLAAIPYLFLMMLVAPIWISPLFNDFGPMKDQALEAKILATAERAGIQGSRVFEVNKSVDTKAVNAYVTGFWGTKRIVLWDTILARLTPRELLTVMGHEMGHYVLHHVVTAILFFSLLTMLTLYLIYRTAERMIRRFQPRFGFSALDDFAALPLVILLFGLYGLVLDPVASAFSRYQEHQADRFGLELIQDNRAAAMAFVKLQQQNLVNPRPGWLYKLWRSSHPPLGERIDFCNTYRPWETGQPLKYGHLFAGPPGVSKRQ